MNDIKQKRPGGFAIVKLLIQHEILYLHDYPLLKSKHPETQKSRNYYEASKQTHKNFKIISDYNRLRFVFFFLCFYFALSLHKFLLNKKGIVGEPNVQRWNETE
ncbi:CLUMA_CG008170, isoform A [Clunio marinus]|uniref:CLUMA_CG008170, isoform A n=1 Tax=Clunio marinus TaxID=568069 RepID=A0A1J1I6U5_9DIPT|nr:CLUMA_CG008170, isoform A [Clunio marinus]